MTVKNTINKILVIIGTVFVWFPIVAPILLGLSFLARRPVFRVDYLMPAELFPVVLLGGLLLLWASLRIRVYRPWIVGGLSVAVGLLVISQGVAVATGLANGTTEPGGWQMALVMGMLIGYILAVVALGIGGILLWRRLFRRDKLV